MTFEEQSRQFREKPTDARQVPFAPYVSTGAIEWQWRGDDLSQTRRAVALLAQPEVVGNRQVTLALARIPAGMAAPWHFHADHEEFVFILDGTGEFWCQGELLASVTQGAVNIIPPGVWHTHRATSEDLLFLWGYAPPGTQLAE